METEKHYKQLDYQDRLAIALGKEQGLSIRVADSVLSAVATGGDITCGILNFQAEMTAQVNNARAAGAVCGGVAFPPALGHPVAKRSHGSFIRHGQSQLFCPPKPYQWLHPA